MSATAITARPVYHEDLGVWCLCFEVIQGQGLDGHLKQFIHIWISNDQFECLRNSDLAEPLDFDTTKSKVVSEAYSRIEAVKFQVFRGGLDNPPK